jgi:signal transduction histidine kinase
VTAPAAAASPDVARFRAKLLVAMMLVVVAITGAALYLAQRNVAAAVERELQREFQSELDALHKVQELRQTALLERCRALVRRPRIHAALEDDALDLLYPSARDELRDLLVNGSDAAADAGAYALHAEFYRFLDRPGAVIPPGHARDIGVLRPEEEAQLALRQTPDSQQLGYLMRSADQTLFEVIAMPIISTETGEVIAALVLGFKSAIEASAPPESGIRRGVWVDGRLHIGGLAADERAGLAEEITRVLDAGKGAASRFRREIGGAPHLLFYNRLNPGSLFPAAYEVCVYPLVELHARQRQLRWRVLGAAGLLLLIGFAASQPLAAKLSQPVEKLAVDSAENRAQRERAEAALELTSAELQRAARFSADASHQLKTPVTVLRAGLEELLAHEPRTPEECHEISALIHQTYRLSSVIEDLLLLSRMDAGRLKIDFAAVDLAHLIETALDDLGAQPDAIDLAIETDFPADLKVAGEKRYLALVLQNLFENARKYNRVGGRIRIAASEEQGAVILTVGNTGKPIPPEARAHIFERFHRGAMGDNVPGYGLGLNLARELVRLHGGDLRLVRSDEGWTEFEASFRLARSANVDSAGGG